MTDASTGETDAPLAAGYVVEHLSHPLGCRPQGRTIRTFSREFGHLIELFYASQLNFVTASRDVFDPLTEA